jgi:hypothetical protein
MPEPMSTPPVKYELPSNMAHSKLKPNFHQPVRAGERSSNNIRSQKFNVSSEEFAYVYNPSQNVSNLSHQQALMHKSGQPNQYQYRSKKSLQSPTRTGTAPKPKSPHELQLSLIEHNYKQTDNQQYEKLRRKSTKKLDTLMPDDESQYSNELDVSDFGH